MNTTPKAQLVHSTKGRARLRIPSKKGDSQFFKQTVEALTAYHTISKVEANVVTGSLLIYYEGDLKDLLTFLETEFSLKVVPGEELSQTLRACLINTYQRLNKHVEKVSSKYLDLATLLAVFFLALGLNELRKGRFSSPPWYVALMSALTLLKGLR